MGLLTTSIGSCPRALLHATCLTRECPPTACQLAHLSRHPHLTGRFSTSFGIDQSKHIAALYCPCSAALLCLPWSAGPGHGICAHAARLVPHLDTRSPPAIKTAAARLGLPTPYYIRSVDVMRCTPACSQADGTPHLQRFVQTAMSLGKVSLDLSTRNGTAQRVAHSTTLVALCRVEGRVISLDTKA